jgi:hypothetical protein
LLFAMNRRKRHLAIAEVEKRLRTANSQAQLARDLGVWPSDVWRAIHNNYASPALVRALDLGRKRYRRCGDLGTAERVGEFDKMCKRKGTSASTILNDWLDWHKGVERGKLKMNQALAGAVGDDDEI